MKNIRLNLLVGLVVIVGFWAISGCATAVHGTRQQLAIDSEPKGVVVKAGTQECKTPCTIAVSRKMDKIILEKDGKVKELELTKGFNGWATIGGNIIWGLGIAIAIPVDYFAGGAFNIENAKLNVDGIMVTIEDLGPE